MAWQKNGTPDTLTVAGDILDISDLTPLKFNVYLTHAIDNGSNVGTNLTLDGVGGTSYALRIAENGAEGTLVSQPNWRIRFNINDQFDVGYIVNITNEEKLMIGWHNSASTAGAATAPNRSEYVGKFVQNAQFTQITNTNDQGGSFDIGSNLSALGTD